MTNEDARFQFHLARARRLELFWRAYLWLTRSLMLLLIAYGALRYPAASIPAFMSASFRRFTSKTPSSRNEFGYVMWWGMIGGAIGYALLASLRIGVPAPDAPLVWRVFGGLVFGSVAGVAASIIVWPLPVIWNPGKYALRPNQHARSATNLRPVTRWLAGILGFVCGAAGFLFLFGVLTTITDEGVLHWSAWGHSLWLLPLAAGEVAFGFMLLKAAWSNKNPSFLEALDREADIPSP